MCEGAIPVALGRVFKIASGNIRNLVHKDLEMLRVRILSWILAPGFCILRNEDFF
jgi:hypothetical protein